MKKTIFIVDDSVTMLLNLRITLERYGYHVEQAKDGVDALEKIQKVGKVACIITDLNMPRMDGITFIREVRCLADYRFIPILMLTTESQLRKKEEGKRAGATGWIVKPFEAEKLQQVLKRVIK